MKIETNLKLKVLEKKPYKVEFKISYQSEALRDRSLSNVFIAGDNFIQIRSSSFPVVDEKNNTFFIRGHRYDLDSNKVKCSKEFYNKIKKAVSEINNIKCIY